MKNLISEFWNKFGGNSSQDIYHRRRQQLEQIYSASATEEKITEDALRGTTEEISAQNNVTIREALNTVFEYIVLPLNISASIFQRVKESLIGWFDPL